MEEIQLFISSFYTENNISVHPIILRHFGFAIGNYLCSLIDYSKSHGDWFIFTTDQQVQTLNLAKTKIKEYKILLIHYKVLEIRRDKGNREEFKINFSEINKILQ